MKRFAVVLLLVFVTGCSKQEQPATVIRTIKAVDMVKAVQADLEKFKAEFVGKELRVTDLVAHTVWKLDNEQYLDAFAYDRASDAIVATGDSKLNGRPVKTADDSFFFRLVFANPADLDTFEDSKVETIDDKPVRDYPAPFAITGTVAGMESDNTINLTGATKVKE